MINLSLSIDDCGEELYVLCAIEGLYKEALSEISLLEKSTDEDDKDFLETWRKRANKYKKIVDELEKHIEIEANKVWVFVKNPEPKKRRTLDYTPIPCTNCGSTNTIANGHRTNLDCAVPKRICKNCGKGYTNKEGASFGMRYPMEIIDKSIELHKGGMSTRNVVKFIQENYHIKISHASVAIRSNNNVSVRVIQPNKKEVIQETFQQLQKTPTHELKMFMENDGFDYRSKHPKIINRTEIYDSGYGKLVIRHHGKGCKGDTVLTSKNDIDRLLCYSEKDADWCIKNLNKEKQNTLRGYLRDIRNS